MLAASRGRVVLQALWASTGTVSSASSLGPVSQLAQNLRSLHSASGAAFSDGSRGDAGSSKWGWALGLAATGAGLAGSMQTEAHAEAAAAEVKAAVDPYQRPTELRGLPKEVTLYQYDVCPFCCKVKAMLDYHKIPYKIIEVNPLTKGELKWSSYRKVPVIKLEGDEVVVDSSAIMSRLAAELEAGGGPGKVAAAAAAGGAKAGSSGRSGWFGGSGGSGGKASTKDVERELEWRKWVDERLVKLITANIYRSWDESWATFGYLTTHTNWAWGTREAARLSGALLMWQVGKRMPAKYGIEGDLREALYTDCNKLVDSLGGQPFLGGSAPNLADLAAFGVLRAVEHTPTFRDAMEHSRIKPWYERMEQAVGPSACVSKA